ncbi:MAG: phage scaffolding protein [Candidatus Acetothermia bacterium]
MAEEENENQETEENGNEPQTSAEDANTEPSGQSESGGNMVPYDRFQQVIEEKNEYKNELEKLKDQLEEMEDPEELKDKYETKLDKMEKKSVDREKEFALKEAALKEGVNKDALDDFATVADLDELEVTDDGDVTGIEDLIETMKDEKSYFFETEQEGPSKVGGEFREGQEETQTDEGLRKAMGLE